MKWDATREEPGFATHPGAAIRHYRPAAVFSCLRPAVSTDSDASPTLQIESNSIQCEHLLLSLVVSRNNRVNERITAAD